MQNIVEYCRNQILKHILLLNITIVIIFVRYAKLFAAAARTSKAFRADKGKEQDEITGSSS
jgi:hypothetical protein